MRLFSVLGCCFLVGLHLSGCAGTMHGKTLLFPDETPDAVQHAKNNLKWMSECRGDDGYVMVRVSLQQPTGSPCGILGKKGWLSTETIQAALSVELSGFFDELNGKSIPLATFDSKGIEGQCRSLEKGPYKVVPFTRIDESGVLDSNALKIILRVHSTVKTTSHLVDKAQLLLGAISVFTTGGAAYTVAEISKLVTNDALGKFFNDFAVAGKDHTDGEVSELDSRIDLAWHTLRQNPPMKYVIRVYKGQTAYGETEKQAARRAKREGKAEYLFDVIIEFIYARSLFHPNPDQPPYYPSADRVTPTTVLQYPEEQKDVPNLLQVLSKRTPSLLTEIATEKNLWYPCATAENLLRKAGLNRIDRLIVLNAFVGEALGSGWITNQTYFRQCFKDLPQLASLAQSMYQLNLSEDPLDLFEPDLQRCTTNVGYHTGCRAWKAELAETLAGFKNAMCISKEEDRVKALSVLNCEKTVVKIQSENKQSTGIAELAKMGFKEGGCLFYYGEDAVKIEEGNKPKGYLTLLDEDEKVWIARLIFTPAKPRTVESILLKKLEKNDAWLSPINSLRFGPTAKCPGIIRRLE